VGISRDEALKLLNVFSSNLFMHSPWYSNPPTRPLLAFLMLDYHTY
jgi:hypothetical protein